jgi:dTMP kinase
MTPPRFFSIDGIDGAGKSTQVRLFCQWLRELGHDVVACRDPGSTPLGETVRKLVLQGEAGPVGLCSEMLLYMAARAQLVEQVIRPALHEGHTVVSDRYLLANVVYQGYGGGLDVDQLWQVGRVATANVMPHQTLVLDLDPGAAAQRRLGPADQMEKRRPEFFERVRKGFLEEARRRPDEIVVVDAMQTIEQVQSDLRAAARSVID